jgi:hypothetical protein
LLANAPVHSRARGSATTAAADDRGGSGTRGAHRLAKNTRGRSSGSSGGRSAGARAGLNVGALSGVNDADLDRRGSSRACAAKATAGARRTARSRRTQRGNVGPPMDRNGDTWLEQAKRLGGSPGVEVPEFDPTPPARDRQRGKVERSQRGHGSEEIRIPCEVHAFRPRDYVPQRGGGVAEGPRPPACSARTASPPSSISSPSSTSTTWRKRRRLSSDPPPRGTTTGSPRPSFFSDGTSRWSQWRCETSTPSTPSPRSSRTGTSRRSPKTNRPSSGSVSSRTPSSSTRRVACPTYVSLIARSPLAWLAKRSA